MAENLASRVVLWQATHGRNDLPWQNTRDPYRVWLSEIMLQQTQVATIKDYYPRFLARFANVKALAAANLDDVLGLWSGLGYYSRARNLHQCAVRVVEDHAGEFPRTVEALQRLPGIGRSTAAAIASLCFGEREAILDGNVRRVLTRVLAFDADLSKVTNQQRLWKEAEALLPTTDLSVTMPRYTQGLMDLGATVCTSRQPECKVCPLAGICVAKQQGEPLSYPVKSNKLKRSTQSIWMLWIQADDGSVWLTKRPTPGVWAGLYCFALFDELEALVEAVPKPYRKQLQPCVVVRHVLTHKDLFLHPIRVLLPTNALSTEMKQTGDWFSPDQWHTLGLPAPIRKLLSQPD